MRIERKGPVRKLTPRLVRFIKEALGGQALDDIQDAQIRRVDYSCLGGLLAVELKSLEEDASERLDNLTDELRQRPDWPVFIGSAPILAILKHMEQPEDVKRRIVDRIGRAIKSHMRKANKQLAAHEEAFKRKNLVKVMVLVNEDHEVYDPELVTHVVGHLLSRRENDAPLYPHIEAVIFFSERHAAYIGQKVSFPIITIKGEALDYANWKSDVIDFVQARFAEWSGVPLYRGDFDLHKFATIENIPEQMKRHEQWELDYRRNPYLKDVSIEQLRDRFDEMVCIASLAFIKGSPMKPDHDAIARSMATMSHMMIEMGGRSIPSVQFRREPERMAAAARRLGLPDDAVSWFERNFDVR